MVVIAQVILTCFILMTQFQYIFVVKGQRTAVRGESYLPGNEPSRTEIINWMNHMESTIRAMHDNLHAMMERLDNCEQNRKSYDCSWLNIANADVKHVFMNFVNVSCLRGFNLDVDRSWMIIQCHANGTWSPTPITNCARVKCPPLQSFTNANLNSTQMSYGTKVNVSCDAGYYLRGNSNWIVTQCNADRKWSEVPPNCTRSIAGTPTLVHSFPGGNAVGALALLGNALFVTRRGLKDVFVYDSTSLQVKRHITIPELSGIPAGLAACPVNNYLYVSDFENRCIHRVDLSTGFVAKWLVNCQPAGLSITRGDHNVLVAGWASQAFYEYTPGGSLVRETKDANNVWQAVQLNSGSLIAITRSEPIYGVAHWTSDGGRVVHIYGNTGGSNLGQLLHPRSLAVDSEDNVIVADAGNNRIQILNGSLKMARLLPINIGVQHPIAVCYDQRLGRLFIGEHTGAMRVLVFDNVTNLSAMFN